MVSLPKQASRPLFLNTGCAARVFGLVAPRSLKIVYKDFLSEKLDRNAKSYWLVRDRSRIRKPVDYEQQY